MFGVPQSSIEYEDNGTSTTVLPQLPPQLQSPPPALASLPPLPPLMPPAASSIDTMDDLKQRISQATPGEVQGIIASAQFIPRLGKAGGGRWHACCCV